MMTGLFLAFAALTLAPLAAQIPAFARATVRRLRRRYSSLLLD
jgi:hypothetical protein